MRPVGWLIAALLPIGGCGSGSPSDSADPKQGAGSAANLATPGKAPDAPGNAARPTADDEGAREIPDDAGTEGMSPSQRRAYDRGFRDCSAGRYEPDHYSEAYRIGCAAAQEQ